jgi:putative ABC transport system permease protein
MALGAGRVRIVRQLITEGVLLSCLGAGAGLPLAIWGITAIKANIPGMVSRHLPGLLLVRLDGRMLAFTLAAAALTSIAFTLPAAIQACRESPGRALKDGGRGLVGSNGKSMRSALVITEAAFSIVLLIGAGLMIKGFRSLAAMKPGFETVDVTTFRVSLPREKYPDAVQITNYYSEILRHIEGIAGMESTAVISELPALADTRSSPILIEGQPARAPERPLLAEVRITSEDYFRAMTIPVLEGRPFGVHDTAGGVPAVVISKGAAERFWPGQKALGRRVRLTSAELNTGWLTVIGIAGDVNHFLLDKQIRPILYLPYRQQPIRSLNIVMRTHAPLGQVAEAVRAAGRAVDPTQPVYDFERIGRFYADLTGGVGVIAALLGIFALIALALATAGIYAVMAYSVAQRRGEIGIRMALGARPHDVRRLIVGNALRLIGTGLGLGLPAAFALTTMVSSVLPAVVAVDAVTFLVFAILLAAVALFASLIPSQRAIRIDPLLALRSE